MEIVLATPASAELLTCAFQYLSAYGGYIRMIKCFKDSIFVVIFLSWNRNAVVFQSWNFNVVSCDSFACLPFPVHSNFKCFSTYDSLWYLPYSQFFWAIKIRSKRIGTVLRSVTGPYQSFLIVCRYFLKERSLSQTTGTNQNFIY